MKRDAAKIFLKGKYAEYLQPARTRANGKPTYICPLCQNGTGENGDGMAVDPKGDGTQLKCFKCGFYGDLIDLYKAEHDCTFNEAIDGLCEQFGTPVDEIPIIAPTEPQEPQERGIEADYRHYYAECIRSLEASEEARKYLHNRGITKAVIDKYCIGFDKKENRIIIPATSGFYLARSINEAESLRYKNPQNARAALFNSRALYSDQAQTVYITEGAFDALAFICAGTDAVALNSASNINLLVDQLKLQPTSKTLLLCLDNDEAGIRQTKQLMAELTKLHIDYRVGTMYLLAGHKDAAEAYQAAQVEFIRRVRDYAADIEQKTARPDNSAAYIRDQLQADIDLFKEGSNRKTGFSALDEKAGAIYSGLYVIGAVSSLGKTSFIYQIADQVAAAGGHVIYFSLEQSRMEMVCKSLARITAQLDIEKAATSLQIRKGATSDIITQAKENYIIKVGERMSIVEGNFNCTAGFIRDYAVRYIERNRVRPLIVVDYLQIMQPEVDPETGRKPTEPRVIADYNVTALKRLSRDLDLPVFVISSLNRSNYMAEIDFECFKESGGIEYTADCIWGMQLEIIHDEIFNSAGDINKKREAMRNAKAAMPRDIELVCLKNRYGRSGYTMNFKYYPQWDLFTEKENETREKQNTPVKRF